MEVMALVGPSGTGKSHRALIVAHEYKADAIIDDGILIREGKIIAGHSAKREASKIMAVRRAIFSIPGHADEIKQAIQQMNPRRILVLGTSENMVHKIAKILGFSAIKKVIRIEDIATKEEIEKARDCRLKEGKHIIPVPTIELKPHFSGYLIDPLESFFKKPQAKRRRLGEKSIVRPIFSYYGKLLIDDSAIVAIVNKVATSKESISRASQVRVKRIREEEEDKGIDVTLEVTMRYGTNLRTTATEIQNEIKIAVENMTGMIVKQVNIIVKTLTIGA
ncbi:Asp23/Gls24 family envelope stress response protein [Anaerosinus massiliensis]|uniref:Asp23/Gls24 family envelope stress response protein n=1 Tax=Massilibacillus massiliensis TaxID=1806837 RepID=UPI000A82B397|nr:Asp23/Gls24 family envelope stress response protein [Massilibacillus massiliensis]